MKGSVSEANTMTDVKSDVISDLTENEDAKPEIKPNTGDIKITPKEWPDTNTQMEIKSENDKDADILIQETDLKEEKIENISEHHCEPGIEDLNSILKETKDRILADSVTDINEQGTASTVVAMKTEIGTREVKQETELITDEVKPVTEKNGDIVKTGTEKNVNPLKRKRCRGVRGRNKKSKFSKQAANSVAEGNKPPTPFIIDLKDDVEYCLTVTNLPNSWSFMDIKNYIDTQCGPVDEIEMLKDDKTGNGAIRLSYQTESECEQAMGKLKDKEIEGTKLVVTMKVVNLESDSEVQVENPNTQEIPEAPEPPGTRKPWTPDLDAWEIDPKGLYGLKQSFLKSIGITPPLDKWVHVSNFRCDKSELRDVLELAGSVIMCSVFNVTTKYANVMYSHPLEAVQAVSLLNGQTLYGQKLKVVMDRSPVNTVLLPKGLSNIGKGLGANGKPLNTILQHYRRFVNNQSASINRAAFEDSNNQYTNVNTEPEEMFSVKSVEEFNYVLPNDAVTNAVNKSTPPANSPASLTKAKPVVQPPTANKVVRTVMEVKKQAVPAPAKSPMRQNNPGQNFQPRNFGPGFGPFGPRPFGSDSRMAGPFGPGPRPMWNGPGPMPGPMGGPRPMQGPGGPMQGPCGPMQGPGGPMHRPVGPMQGPGAPMQGPGGPMQGPGGPIQRPPGPMQGPLGPMPRPIGPMSRPVGPMPMAGPPGPMQRPPGPMQGPAGPMQGPAGPQMYGNEPVQLQLSNLPPSTTFAILCEKMAACGQVVSIQLTTPGCAVVTFANRMLADRCIMTYNNVCIEGHMIQVKYT